MVLPQMHHYMRQRGQHVCSATANKVLRVQRDFVSDRAAVVGPPVAPEIPIRAVMALQGDEARRQLPPKEGGVKEIVGPLQLGIGFCGWLWHGRVLRGKKNSIT